MGQGESRISDTDKLKIRKAIWNVYQFRYALNTSEDYERELFEQIQMKFLLHECTRNRLISTYTPDILIKEVAVIEVKHIRWANLDSTTKGKIETYMKLYSLPGLLVNFPHEGYPYIRWYYLDETKNAKLEHFETLNKEPTLGSRYDQNQESNSDAFTGSRYDQNQESNSDAFTGHTVIRS